MSEATGEKVSIRPQPGRQEQFLSSPADITIYGGAAGGGKTYGLLLEPLRHINNPGFGAVILRRTFPEIVKEGGMWDEASGIYPHLGGTPNKGDRQFVFPAGGKITFGHMQLEKDKYSWKGAQIPLLCFDQLESFTESQFFYMLSRNRSTCGVRPYIRATCNPDADSWLAQFLSWWIAEDGYADLLAAGELRWFVRVGERLEWADTAAALTGRFPDLLPKSVTFIPASVHDNKILMEKDPGYLANLMALPLVEQERLLGDAERGGNWKIKPAAGNLYNRSWYSIVEAIPAGGEEVLYWDLASTKKELSGNDPSYTAGVVVRQVDGKYYVHDCQAEQIGPAAVEQMFVNVSRQAAARAYATGARFRVRWEIEPGSAAKRESARLAKLLDGLDAHGVNVSGEKLSRGRAFAAQSKSGNVMLVEGTWNEGWLVHMHNQPDIPHNDIHDGTVGAYNELVGGKKQAGAWGR